MKTNYGRDKGSEDVVVQHWCRMYSRGHGACAFYSDSYEDEGHVFLQKCLWLLFVSVQSSKSVAFAVVAEGCKAVGLEEQ